MSLVMSGSYMDKPISQLPLSTQGHVVGLGLGRVVAHEIGHWLMGSGHTEEGLMRPESMSSTWSDRTPLSYPARAGTVLAL